MKKITHNRLPLLLPLLLIFNSCIGLSMDIQMRANGSGRISAEYRISNMAETIGRLDGNENWPIIPAGRADFERTVARIDGMRLVSFSSKEGTQEVVYNAMLEFENTGALVKFLDPMGTGTSFNPGRLDIIIKKADQTEMDLSLLDLTRQVFAGYRFTVSFSAEGNSSLTVTDGAGREITSLPDAQIIKSGRKVSLSIGMAQLISLKGGLGAGFRW